jgi:uncharacterized damage-inducible protein DinB
MSTIETFIKSYEFNRQRTLGLLDKVAKEPQPARVLVWRPGPGRAHIGWQIMHIGITEEIFATERLLPASPKAFADLWPRFRGGSTPDENVPSPDQIREILAASRQHLLETLRTYNEDRLGEIPEALKERKLTVQDVLYIIGFHEAHHQGQAHITFNLYKATQNPS